MSIIQIVRAARERLVAILSSLRRSGDHEGGKLT